MTDAELTVALFKYIRARKQDTSVFYDHGSVRNTALLVAGLSLGRTLFTSEIDCPWDRHFAVTKFLEHFDNTPGTLCASLITSVLRDHLPGQLRYKDIQQAAGLIRNASVPKLLGEFEQWHIDPTVKVSAILSNILLAHDCADLAFTIAQADTITKELMRMHPFQRDNDCLMSNMLTRNETFDTAHPVLRTIHAELIEAYSNLYHRE